MGPPTAIVTACKSFWETARLALSPMEASQGVVTTGSSILKDLVGKV